MDKNPASSFKKWGYFGYIKKKKRKKESEKKKEQKQKKKKTKRRKRTEEQNRKRKIKRRKSEKGITPTLVCTQAFPYLELPVIWLQC